MALLQRFFGKFRPRTLYPTPLCLSVATPSPRTTPHHSLLLLLPMLVLLLLPPPSRPLFRPPGIYIIVLPGSPLNRVAERDSAGASFRADVDGRSGDLANKRIEGKHPQRSISAYLEPGLPAAAFPLPPSACRRFGHASNPFDFCTRNPAL